MIFEQLLHEDTSTYTDLLADEDAREAALFDPVVVDVARRYLPRLRELGVPLVLVFDTHVHADHVTGAGALREATGSSASLPSHARASSRRSASWRPGS
jgi:sulfur dioxygenase